jgi:hypothetical protein
MKKATGEIFTSAYPLVIEQMIPEYQPVLRQSLGTAVRFHRFNLAQRFPQHVCDGSADKWIFSSSMCFSVVGCLDMESDAGTGTHGVDKTVLHDFSPYLDKRTQLPCQGSGHEEKNSVRQY